MKKRIIIFSLTALLMFVCAITIKTTSVSFAQESYNAKAALLMDYNTGEILYSQSENQRLPIASMVKIMTLNIIFEEIENGTLSLQDKITVSPNAAGMGGSQAFLDANAEYPVDELIKSIIVASANDSCVALAEHIEGGVEGFVSRMNQKAAEWGMADTKFANCTGLPAPDSYSCAKDVAVMFRSLIRHQQFFEYSKIWMYDFVHPNNRTTTLTNTNKLVRFYTGCDGGKTGFTKDALSCLAATALRGDTRLIGVIIAAPEAKERNAQTSKLLNYGFSNFETKKVVFKGEVIEERAIVEKGKADSVLIAPATDYYYLTKKGEKPKIEFSFEINKVQAPVSKGDTAGKLNIMVDNQKIADVDLIAAADIEKATYLDFVDKMIKAW